MGVGCFLIKMDINEAYRVILIRLIDQLLQGVMHKNHLYFDRCLTFSNYASAGIFCRLTDLVAWITVQHRIKAIIHYIDNFLMFVNACHYKPEAVLFLFQSILDTISFLYKKEKTIGLVTRLDYLGISLDTVKMSAVIPTNKRHQIIKQLAP